MKPFRSHRVPLRGLDAHVLTWGDPAAPKLFLLHGWMDVAASFQFLVDAFVREWHVIAPDLRGYGRSAWQPQGYWYADYIADLEALLADVRSRRAGEHRRAQPRRQCRAPLRWRAPGARADRHLARRVRRPGRGPGRGAGEARQWLDAIAESREFATYPDFDAVADRLQKNNPRLPRAKAAFLARHWAESLADGRVRLASDPRHRLPFPTVYRIEETYAVWRNITAPTLWVAAAESHIPAWLDGHPEGEGATDSFAGIRRRFAHVPRGKLVTIAGAGHMLHHDQPEAVAAAMEDFLLAG